MQGFVYIRRIHDYIPFIKDIYLIRSDGIIFSESRKYKYYGVLNQTIDSWGYLQIRLMGMDGKIHSYTVHRLVMKCFSPIQNPECFQVNHKDGNKQNNDISNLEWCTSCENIQHAYDNNLIPKRYGEQCKSSSISNEVAKIICELLSKGYSKPMIIQELYSLGYQVPAGIDNIISKIYRRSAWTWLSNDYEFPKGIVRDRYALDITQVNNVCKMLEDGVRDFDIIISRLGYSNLNKEDYKRIKKCIAEIKNKIHYTNISVNYDF